MLCFLLQVIILFYFSYLVFIHDPIVKLGSNIPSADVFFISGGAFLRGPSMRWTSHMEDSLNLLASNPEWEGDQILVLMVRIRKLADNIIQAQATWASDSEPSGTFKPPVTMYVKYYHQWLQKIRDQLPESLKDNREISPFYHSEVCRASFVSD